LKESIEHLMGGTNVSATIKPKLMSHLIEGLPALPAALHEEIASFFLQKINSSNTRAAHDRQVRELHTNLGALYEAAEDWPKAAKTLCKIPFNGVQINMSGEDKLGAYVKIAELFLRYHNSLEAGTYINKALHELTQIQSPLERGEQPPVSVRQLKARLEICVAKRDDLSGEYGKAAKSYEKLSRNSLAYDLAGGQAQLLKQAVLCALLMPAGKASRMLDGLTADDRVNPEKTPELTEIYPIMTKMHQERVMRAADIESLLSHVQDYQRESVLRSIKEHNLLAASKIYRNISIEELARLLQIEPLEAEQVAAGMMKEGRLKGSIDQQENLLTFEDARAEVSMW
jgi:COP9 signalosome complex subunit 4